MVAITLVWQHIQIFYVVPMKLPLPGIHVVHVIHPKSWSNIIIIRFL